jgi:hypothetical protein
LADGPIRVQVQSPGFSSIEIAGLIVSSQKPTQQDVRLNPGSISQTVEVQAAAPTAHFDTSSLAAARNGGNGRQLGNGSGLGSAKGGNRGDGNLASTPGERQGTFLIDAARAGMETAARSEELGDLFEYKLKDPITILKNRSALVPIVQSSIGVEKVSIWNEKAGLPRPQRALWITNSTGLTLDGGSVSILEDDTFAGEGIFEPIRSGERRLLSYATDLAVNASSRTAIEQEHVSRVRIDRGTMIQESEVREKKTYSFRNEDSAPRTIIVEHPVRAGYELRGDTHPAETTPEWMRFRLPVEPKKTASLTIEEARPIQASFAVTNISSDQLTLFVSQHSITPALEAALHEILEQKDTIAKLESQKSNFDAEAQKIFDDQQRLRENIKALKGTPEEKPLLQRYTQQLNAQENRLEVLQKEDVHLDAQIEAAQARLDETIQKLSSDMKL